MAGGNEEADAGGQFDTIIEKVFAAQRFLLHDDYDHFYHQPENLRTDRSRVKKVENRFQQRRRTIMAFPDDVFEKHVRLAKKQFHYLCRILRDFHLLKDGTVNTVEDYVLVGLLIHEYGCEAADNGSFNV